MKKAILLLLVGMFTLAACTEDEEVIAVLSDQEESDLRFLREEEKLARDVYIYSFNKYNQTIFSNIASSEQMHMDRVLVLLNKYGIPDPAANTPEGVFVNSELQDLYDQLTAISDSSLEKALEVGANIEDLDINDIVDFTINTSNVELLETYDLLTCGSRNHLRSFVSKLGTYTPIFISQAEYDAIINSGSEQCGI